MMKKWLVIICVMSLMFAMTGCGGVKTAEVPAEYEEMIQNEVLSEAVSLFQNVVSVSGTPEQAIYEKIAFYKAGIQSWTEAQSDIGECDPSKILNERVVKTNDKEYEVSFDIEGTNHDATIVTVFEEEVDIRSGIGMVPVSIATNVDFSSGELIRQAGMNTILGMGTTFVVLILLSLIISCFTIIPRIEASRKAKAQAAAASVSPAPVSEPAKAAEPVSAPAGNEQDLIAVIAAAIAASQGRESTDGLVVRSITRRGWKR